MKAAVYLGPGKIEVKEVPTPEPKPGEVLINVKACAVCGTDVRIYTTGQKNVVPPRITGHEIAGIIAKIGSDVQADYAEGDKVTVVTSIGDQTCRYCQKGFYNLCDDPRYLGYYYDGGFAEYVIVPEEAVKGNNIIRIDADIDFPEISLIEPLSCCINGQEYLDIQEGDNAVIFGAGPIGLMHVELVKASGADKVILVDIVQQRLDMAKDFSVTHTINSNEEDVVKKVLEITGQQGADVIITAASAKIIQEQALEMAAKKARISFFAGINKEDPFIKFNSNTVHYKEISVFGVFASYRKQFEKAYQLIADKKIDPSKFITHKFPLDRIVEAFETSKSGQGLKSVVIMG